MRKAIVGLAARSAARSIAKVKKLKLERGIKKLTKAGEKSRSKSNAASRKRLADAKKAFEKKEKATPKGKSAGTKDYVSAAQRTAKPKRR